MLCGYTPFWDGGSPMKIYENILRGKVKYPPYLNPDAQNLLSQLITSDLTKRLGNLVGGSKDVMNHPWFAEVVWERLARRDIDAPYVPPVRGGAGDASLFDKYPEETEQYGSAGDDPYVDFPLSLECARSDRLLTYLKLWTFLCRVLESIEGSKGVMITGGCATLQNTRGL
jgi:protein kinase A